MKDIDNIRTVSFEKKIIPFAVALVLLAAVFVFGHTMGYLPALRMIAVAGLLSFLPGLVWSHVIFRTLGWIERCAFAFFLSITAIPLIVYGVTRIGAPLTGMTAFSVAVTLIALGLLSGWLQQKRMHLA